MQPISRMAKSHVFAQKTVRGLQDQGSRRMQISTARAQSYSSPDLQTSLNGEFRILWSVRNSVRLSETPDLSYKCANEASAPAHLPRELARAKKNRSNAHRTPLVPRFHVSCPLVAPLPFRPLQAPLVRVAVRRALHVLAHHPLLDDRAELRQQIAHRARALCERAHHRVRWEARLRAHRVVEPLRVVREPDVVVGHAGLLHLFADGGGLRGEVGLGGEVGGVREEEHEDVLVAEADDGVVLLQTGSHART